jgi:hypothetical protein
VSRRRERTVKVDKATMADHDDIWSRMVMNVILQLYRATVYQTDTHALEVQKALKVQTEKLIQPSNN